MPLLLPDLSRSAGFVRIVACGEVSKADEALKSIIDEDVDARSSYTVNGIRHYMRLLTGPASSRKKTPNHFHVEIALRGYFRRGGIPKSTHKLSEVRRLLNEIPGSRLTIWGTFNASIPFSELPESGIIRLISIETKVGKVGVHLHGGNLLVTGSPVFAISWTRAEDWDNCRLSMVAHFEGFTAKETYLSDVHERLKALFDFHVLGKEPPDYV